MLTDTDLHALKEKITELSEKTKPLIIAVDGRCASGKTTLANKLSQLINANVVHTDDFYPQAFQRTKQRYNEPGGNLDRERLLKEIILPLKNGTKPSYIPFDCKALCFKDEIPLPEKDIYIIEGSYSCHPDLNRHYALTVFVTTDKQTQKERILSRNGKDKLHDFLNMWIPLEEKYFSTFDIQSLADIIIET